ncbi:LacI family DNA-binding transcriptional regulator [Parasulfitobacter algicola]|uniref:LacI family DNA-binding transcriptional regulator n=1 Tax=Parasulfitobacter algicola TaxID=2614809 RepID=A0ABX2IW59_9RHOB|nr:LacI family DNA-binding transcriptional regulator [Sulfitobacter algicola]NSX54639.1 LacI family DNA-binding transcriptional regulator [Sulfitobacter algicola]
MTELRVTSLDVAKLAGVSQSAVSRVFTPGASASKETITKVRKAAEKLGYRPNALARAMITGKSRIIGLVVAYLDNQFYPIALERLSNALQDRGYHILIFTATNTQEAIDKVMQELIDYQVDGIITASVGMTSELTGRCAAAGIPVVMFNRAQDGSGLSSVTSANENGARKIADFLVAGGHSHIAHIAGWGGSSTGRDRIRGFIDGLAKHEKTPVAVIDGMYSRDVSAQATRDLMALPNRPDAIFVGNDHMAFAVLDTLRHEYNMSVPDDVSVIGFDDVPLASWAAYDLTTVRQPVNRMVDATVETILAQIGDKNRPTQKIEIDGPLIIRSSARIPEGWHT